MTPIQYSVQEYSGEELHATWKHPICACSLHQAMVQVQMQMSTIWLLSTVDRPTQRMWFCSEDGDSRMCVLTEEQ